MKKTRQGLFAPSRGWASLRAILERDLTEARLESGKIRARLPGCFDDGFYRGEIGVLERVLGALPKEKKAKPNDQRSAHGEPDALASTGDAPEPFAAPPC